MSLETDSPYKGYCLWKGVGNFFSTTHNWLNWQKLYPFYHYLEKGLLLSVIFFFIFSQLTKGLSCSSAKQKSQLPQNICLCCHTIRRSKLCHASKARDRSHPRCSVVKPSCTIFYLWWKLHPPLCEWNSANVRREINWKREWLFLCLPILCLNNITRSYHWLLFNFPLIVDTLNLVHFQTDENSQIRGYMKAVS